GLFLESQDYESAIETIVLQAPVLLSQGRSATIRDCVRRLPRATPTSEPWLGFWAGMAELCEAPARAAELLETSVATFERNGDAAGFWTAWCALTQARLLEG